MSKYWRWKNSWNCSKNWRWKNTWNCSKIDVQKIREIVQKLDGAKILELKNWRCKNSWKCFKIDVEKIRENCSKIDVKKIRGIVQKIDDEKKSWKCSKNWRWKSSWKCPKNDMKYVFVKNFKKLTLKKFVKNLLLPEKISLQFDELFCQSSIFARFWDFS